MNKSLKIIFYVISISSTLPTTTNNFLDKLPGTACEKKAIALLGIAIASGMKGLDSNPKYVALSLASSCAAFAMCIHDLRCSSMLASKEVK